MWGGSGLLGRKLGLALQQSRTVCPKSTCRRPFSERDERDVTAFLRAAGCHPAGRGFPHQTVVNSGTGPFVWHRSVVMLVLVALGPYRVGQGFPRLASSASGKFKYPELWDPRIYVSHIIKHWLPGSSDLILSDDGKTKRSEN